MELCHRPLLPVYLRAWYPALAAVGRGATPLPPELSVEPIPLQSAACVPYTYLCHILR